MRASTDCERGSLVRAELDAKMFEDTEAGLYESS